MFNDNYISLDFYELSQFVEILKILTRKFQNFYYFDTCHFTLLPREVDNVVSGLNCAQLIVFPQQNFCFN
jgi:hypothetical protein